MFQGVARRKIPGRRLLARGEIRRGQRAAVHLAVGGKRQTVQCDERRRDHVLRQGGPRRRAQTGGQTLAGFRRGDRVGDESPGSRLVLAGQHDAFLHAGLPVEHRFDLAEFDAEAADLHLMIQPPQAHDAAVRQPAGEVAGAVETRARPARERVADKLVEGQLGVVEITAPDLRAADVQFARHADRHRLAAPVEEIDLRVRQRPADGDDPRAVVVARARSAGHLHGGLGGAVKVVELHRRAAEHLVEPPGHLPRQRLAVAADPAQGPAACREVFFFQEHGQHRRDEVRERDALLGDGASQVVAVRVHPRTRHHDGGSRDQRREELRHRQVERKRRLLEDAFARAKPVSVRHPAHTVADVAVGEHRSLGSARGTGRVDHVRELIRQDFDGGCLVALRCNDRPVGIQPDHPRAVRGQAAGETFLGQ